MHRWSPTANEVTVFEKAKRPAGVPLCRQGAAVPGVEANEKSFERYVADLAAACVRRASPSVSAPT